MPRKDTSDAGGFVFLDSAYIYAPTAGAPVLTLQTTDDDNTNPHLELHDGAGALLAHLFVPDQVNFLGTMILGTGGTALTHAAGDEGRYNLAIGVDALASITTGGGNVAMGYRALRSLTTNWENVAIGMDALYSNITGYANTAVGFETLRSNLVGGYNVALGRQALRSNTASGNIAVGVRSLYSNTTGYYNIAFGSDALRSNVNGFYNFAAGLEALYSNVSGIHDIGCGVEAIRANTSGSYNIGFGTRSLYSNNGSYNVGLGVRTLYYNVTGDYNIAVGYEAGYGVVGNSHSNNAFLGYRAGHGITTGSNNFCAGYEAGFSLTTGGSNLFLGYQAGYNETLSNRLYIANTNTATPLIYGEFDTWRLAFGNQYAVDKYGQLTHASGQFAAAGDAQGSGFVCRLARADHAVNTWYALYPDGGTTPERLTIAADTSWTIHVLVNGLTQNAAQQWGYEIIGLLERDNAGNTTLAGQTQRIIFESDANYDAQLANDDANEALEVQVRRTGGVDYDVRWTAVVRLTETTYPS